ncbi:kinesin-related protein 9-like [Armigeres subalbatus]|uniref:kinesin-related protein 9-like n=1 Tax=Armigeres subalbatus TaxID=124917 RepID=UPI002ED6877E
MSSVHAVSFNRQYGSFRTTNAGIPKSPVIGGLNRGLIATISTTAQPNRVITRSLATSSTASSASGAAGGGQSTSSVKNQENLPNTRVLAVTPRSCRKALTSNGGHTTNGNCASSSSTKKIGLNSPLQSPQIIRSTRIEQNNWNKKLTTSNFCSLHSKSPGSSGTSVESIVPKYTNSVSSNNGALKASFPAFGARGNAADGLITSSNGSQKRVYNVNKPIARGATKPCVGSTHSNSSSSSNNSSTSCANSSNSRINNGCVAHKIVTKKLYRESNAPSGYVAQMASALSNGLNTNTSTVKTSTHSSSSSSSSYSSKFPNGLPFENEFYRQPRRSISEVRPTEYPSRQSQRRSNSSDTVSLSAYGDEFSRKPSNEDLFVDFTKSLPETPRMRLNRGSPLLPPLAKPSSSVTAATSSIVEYRNINHSNYFYKFESIHVGGGGCGGGGANRHLRRQRRPSRPRLLDDSRNNNRDEVEEDAGPVEPMAVSTGPDRCGSGNENGIANGEEDDDDDEGGDEMEGERSTVYVAVATWVPKCNRLPYQHESQQQHGSGNGGPMAAAGVLGPTSDNSDFDGSSRRRRERSKRSHHRRSPDSSRRRNRDRHREDKSSRRHHKDRDRKEREDRTPVKVKYFHFLHPTICECVSRSPYRAG